MQSRTVARLTGALLIALVAAGLNGCTRQVTGPSLVLRLATPDRRTDATGPQVAHFAEEVSRRSGGSIRIDPVWDVTPDGAHDWDQTVARGVADGTWEMGLVPGRAWDVLGVDSLRALNTPFLITSQAALRSVLDSDLRGDLLAGLPAAGVTGLDLFPDQLRHPFGYDRALLGADDYTGQSIRRRRPTRSVRSSPPSTRRLPTTIRTPGRNAATSRRTRSRRDTSRRAT